MTERQSSGKDVTDGAATSRQGKKPYVKPTLVDYGSVSKLSAAKPGTLSDGKNTQPKTCL